MPQTVNAIETGKIRPQPAVGTQDCPRFRQEDRRNLRVRGNADDKMTQSGPSRDSRLKNYLQPIRGVNTLLLLPRSTTREHATTPWQTLAKFTANMRAPTNRCALALSISLAFRTFVVAIIMVVATAAPAAAQSVTFLDSFGSFGSG